MTSSSNTKHTIDSRPGESVTEAAYRCMKEAILSAAILPGERITEEQIAERFGISRTPVRETIFRLVAEGFLEIDSRNHVCVHRPSLRDLQFISETRDMVEGYSAALAAQRISDQELAALRIVNERLAGFLKDDDIGNCGRMNAQFHQMTVSATHNSRIQAIAQSLTDCMRLYMFQVSIERIKDVVVEHQRIIQALAARDPAMAQEAAREHVQHAYQHYLEALHTRLE